VLLDIGRLPDAQRRLEIALALSPRYVLAWTLQARLLAQQGRWPEFHALVDGQLADLRYRSPHVARMMLWNPDPAALARLARVYATNADNLPRALCQVGQALVDFGLGRGDRGALLDDLANAPGFTHPRHLRFILQARCELACVLGDHEQALALLVRADAHSLCDWSWIDGCPLLEPLRQDPVFLAVRGRVRLRADTVAEALWS
jgi:tetratricopeptide (TPR) repeat protein